MGNGRISNGVIWAWLAAVLLAIGLSGSRPAEAAVRVCAGHVSSDVAKAATEADAKREAITSWVRKATSDVIPFPAWRIANTKVVKCVRAPTGKGFECVAYASPCTIRQAAPALPKPGAPPAAVKPKLPTVSI